MERLPGRALDLHDIEEDDEQYGQTRVAAEMVFQQLAAFIMQLGTLILSIAIFPALLKQCSFVAV